MQDSTIRKVSGADPCPACRKPDFTVGELHRSEATDDLVGLAERGWPVRDTLEVAAIPRGPHGEALLPLPPPSEDAPKFQSPDGWVGTVGILGAFVIGSALYGVVSAYEYTRDSAKSLMSRIIGE